MAAQVVTATKSFFTVASPAAFRFLRQLKRPSAPRPVAKSGRAPGIGTVEGTPGTSNAPSVVPNENVALVMSVLSVMPASEITNNADWLRNRLCGPFPAIEPLALLYTLPASGGPIIRCAGPIGVQSTFKRSAFDAGELRAQPVETVSPVVKVPSPATVIS